MAEKEDVKVQIELGHQQLDNSELQRRISGDANTTEANINLQNAFYGESGQEENILPVYVAQESTPAININPKD